MKRVYEVALQDHAGRVETRYVLAKSVGWGWLGYHALIAADALAPFVPPVLGLRDGILYTEWLPDGRSDLRSCTREEKLHTIAAYVGTRVRSLRLKNDPAPELSGADYPHGFDLLAAALGGAYRWRITAALRGTRIRREQVESMGIVGAA